MFLINRFLKPQCLVKEHIFFRYDYFLYVVRFYEGYEEMWAESLYDGGHRHVFLGTVRNGEWIKPKNFHLLKWNMQGDKNYGNITGATRLFHELQNFDRDETKNYSKKIRKEKKEFTREDFVKWGKLGQEKVRSKYRVRNSVILRHQKNEKLSPHEL